MKKNLKIAFVGLTHLGLIYLAASSQKGFKVKGIDLDEKKIKKLKKFDIEYKEPNLKKILFNNKKNIIFSSNFNDLSDCSIVFVSQDILTDFKDKADLYYRVKRLIHPKEMGSLFKVIQAFSHK